MLNISYSVRSVLTTTVVVGFFVFSYKTFSSYQPKVLKEIREVKGYSTEKSNAFELPIPRYAKSLGHDQTAISNSYTFQTEKSPSEIKEFYSNVLLDDGWRLKKEGSSANFYTAEYRKDNYSVTLWANFDNNLKMTMASVEIVEL